MEKEQLVIKKKFWEEKYLSNNTPWDIGEPAPAFVKYFSRVMPWSDSTTLKIAVLGCGRGHDAFYVANLSPNVEVHGFDYSESAINFCNCQKEENKLKNIFFHTADFFDLPKDEKWKSTFDIVLEHTSFCAIAPSHRKQYIETIKYLLRTGGKLIGLFLIRPLELGGPPFGCTKEEIGEFLKYDFIETEVLIHEHCPHTFKAEEYFGVFEKLGK